MDSKKYAATDGWGIADFKDGNPADESVHKGCFSCISSPKITTSSSLAMRLNSDNEILARNSSAD
jgi:hypothetical protein